MGLTANRLGYPDAAEELLRAGWAYANVIDHNALRGMVRARLSYVMYWRGRYADSRDLAADGLRYASRGLVGANLHLEQARALARLGEPDAARQQVGLAHAAWADRSRDDLAEIGGEEFALSQAAAYSMAGSALAETGHGREAAGELERAILLYDQGPGPGEHHGVAGQALARTDLAMVRLRSGRWTPERRPWRRSWPSRPASGWPRSPPGSGSSAVSLPRRSSGTRSRPATSATRSRTSAGRRSPRGCTPCPDDRPRPQGHQPGLPGYWFGMTPSGQS